MVEVQSTQLKKERKLITEDFEDRLKDLKDRMIDDREQAVERERQRADDKIQAAYDRQLQQFNHEKDMMNDQVQKALKAETDRTQGIHETISDNR